MRRRLGHWGDTGRSSPHRAMGSISMSHRIELRPLSGYRLPRSGSGRLRFRRARGAGVGGSLSPPPLHSFFVHHRGHLKRIAFFVTFGGLGADVVTRQAAKLFGRADVQISFLKDSEMKSGSFRGRGRDFILALRVVGA